MRGEPANAADEPPGTDAGRVPAGSKGLDPGEFPQGLEVLGFDMSWRFCQLVGQWPGVGPVDTESVTPPNVTKK